MKHFKNDLGQVFAFDEDQIYNNLVPGYLTPMTDDEVMIHTNPPVSEEIKIQRVLAEVQAYMDSLANQAGYDDIKSAVTYADEPAVQKFQNEGRAFRAWRSISWAKCYELLAKFESGELRQMTAEEVIGELPVLVLPQ